MKPMATNGMAPSFFPANFLLQMQQPLPHHHHHPQQEHPRHEHEHHLLAPPPPSISPFLHDFGGAMAPPMLAGGIGNKPLMYPLDAVREDMLAEPQPDGAGSDDEEGSAAAGGGGCGGERKRRLSVDQVRTLERSFEVANKLEPERKAQLARALGLQPRQVAIWFQNRRARWKTKQLEKDYEALRRQLDAARAENDALLSQNKKLHAEIMALKGGGGVAGGGRQEAASELINLNVKETEASCSNRSENSSEINLDISRTAPAAVADESHMNNNNRAAALPFYASAVGGRCGGSGGLDIDQLLQHSHTSAPKMELGHGGADTAGASTFGSLLCGGAVVDEQPSFWPWAADSHHNFQ